MKTTIFILLVVALSAYIGYADLNQSDTAITVVSLLVLSAIVGALADNKLWVYGLIMGLGVPFWEIIAAMSHWTLRISEHGQIVYAAAKFSGIWTVGLFTLLIGFFGVYSGAGIKKLFRPEKVS